ncbi:hypothetical protein AOLI_G00199210 [Acnodon oligacanthus]
MADVGERGPVWDTARPPGLRTDSASPIEQLRVAELLQRLCNSNKGGFHEKVQRGGFAGLRLQYEGGKSPKRRFERRFRPSGSDDERLFFSPRGEIAEQNAAIARKQRRCGASSGVVFLLGAAALSALRSRRSPSGWGAVSGGKSPGRSAGRGKCMVWSGSGKHLAHFSEQGPVWDTARPPGLRTDSASPIEQLRVAELLQRLCNSSKGGFHEKVQRGGFAGLRLQYEGGKSPKRRFERRFRPSGSDDERLFFSPRGEIVEQNAAIARKQRRCGASSGVVFLLGAAALSALRSRRSPSAWGAVSGGKSPGRSAGREEEEEGGVSRAARD